MTHPTTPWTESEDDLLREHYATMDRQQLAQLVGHSVNATAVRAYKLGLKRDPALVRAARMKAGANGAAAAKARGNGWPYRGGPKEQPAVRETSHSIAYRKRRMKAAAEALIEHGVEPGAAELAVHLVMNARVPGVRWEP